MYKTDFTYYCGDFTSLDDDDDDWELFMVGLGTGAGDDEEKQNDLFMVGQGTDDGDDDEKQKYPDEQVDEQTSRIIQAQELELELKLVTEMTKRSSSILTSRCEQKEKQGGGSRRCWRKGSWHDWSRETRTDKAAQTCILITNCCSFPHDVAYFSHYRFNTESILTWDTFSSFDCDLIHMTALL